MLTGRKDGAGSVAETLHEVLLGWLKNQGGEVQAHLQKALAEQGRLLLRRRATLHLTLEFHREERELVAA